MDVNGKSGILLVQKYLVGGDLDRKAKHSLAVGNLCSHVAKRIVKMNPQIQIDINLCEFIGYCHDIGYGVTYDNHEQHTVNLLIEEGFSPEIAQKTMHGHLAEEFDLKFLPIGIEGEILTYCDMSVNTGEPVSVQERANEIITRVSLVQAIPKEKRASIVKYLLIALPRFKSYEQKFLALGKVKSVKEFLL